MGHFAGFDLRPRDRWIVVATLITTLVISTFAYVYSKNVNHARNQSRFETMAIEVDHDLTSTMIAYGQVLRSAVAFLNAKPDASRLEWRTFVENLQLEQSYPGIQGVSFNGLLHSAFAARQFETRIRRTDRPDFAIKPVGDRELYAPVLYLEPLTPANEGAIGFDIYSEANRRETVDRAIATREPNLTAKITLVQESQLNETSSTQAGVLLILPVVEAARGDTPDEAISGVVVSVFRMGDLVTNILERSKGNPGQDVEVTLYDASEEDTEAILFDASSARSGQALYTASRQIELFGRNWLIKSRSTEAFEARVATLNHTFLLAACILVSILLTLLVWGQAIRYRDSLVSAERLQNSNNRIVDLMGEVNHRSKNLLGVVQAIAHQTNSQDPANFSKTFSQRLGALSASQDILVRNEWAHIGLEDLVRSQCAHLEDLVDTRIQISGDEIKLSAAQAQAIGMAVHELATNACKFGALSNDSGAVSIDWDIDPADTTAAQFRMSWVERGGPSVTEPSRTGFGSKVTGAMTEFALSARIVRTFEPGGFEWRLTCPADMIRDLPPVKANADPAIAAA